MTITFLVGHPVPYSITVQRNGRSTGARRHLEAVRNYLHERVPDREVIITKVEGAYVFYDFMPEGWKRPRLSFAAIDLGFDPRLQKMACEYPHWAGDGPVLLSYDTRGTETPSEAITRKCDSRAEALRILRRHGYRITLGAPEKAPSINEPQKPAEIPAYVRRLRRHPRVDGTWARIHDDGMLELRDPNDGQSSDPADKCRHQYRVARDGNIVKRRLPPESVGDQWVHIGPDDLRPHEWELSQTPPADDLLYAWWEEQVL